VIPRVAADARLANDRQLLAHHTELVLDGPGAGTRVCSVQPDGGLHLRVLLDRGMDIGAAWFAGRPLAWLSPSGERTRGYADASEGWHRGWAGGLLTTCGLRHIGPPAVTGGRHGNYSECPVEDFGVAPMPGGVGLELRGTVRDTDGLDRGLLLERTIRVHARMGLLEVSDVVTNEGPRPVAAPLLYHLNLGHPFLGDTSRTRLTNLAEGHGFTPEMGAPADVPDVVVRHRPLGAGEASAEVDSDTGLTVRVSWDTGRLPLAYTWRRRTPGCYVHAIEPATAHLSADAHAWPVLDPGQQRATGVRVTVHADNEQRIKEVPR